MTVIIFNATARVTVNTSNLSRHVPTCTRAWKRGWHVNNDINGFITSDGAYIEVSPYGYINTEQTLSEKVIQEAVDIFTPTFEAASPVPFHPCIIEMNGEASKKQLIESCFLVAEQYYMTSVSQPSLANRSAGTLLALSDRLSQVAYHDNKRVPYVDNDTVENNVWNMTELLRQQATHLRELTYRARKRSIAWRMIRVFYLSLTPIITTLFGWFAFHDSPIGAVLFGGCIPLAVFAFLANEDDRTDKDMTLNRVYVPELPQILALSLSMEDIRSLAPTYEYGWTSTVWNRLCYRWKRFVHRWFLDKPYF